MGLEQAVSLPRRLPYLWTASRHPRTMSGTSSSKYIRFLPAWSFLRVLITNRRLWVSIIRQEHTWGRLLITLDAFQSLLSLHNVFWHYISYVQAFGNRDADEEKSRSAYFWQKSQHSAFDGMWPCNQARRSLNVAQKSFVTMSNTLLRMVERSVTHGQSGR